MERAWLTTLRHRPASIRKRLLAAALLVCASAAPDLAAAQEVRIFEQTPSVEELRQVLAPELQQTGPATHGLTRSLPIPGKLTRKIEIPRRESLPSPSTQPIEPAVAATVTPAPPSPKRPAQDGELQPGIVGFRIPFALNSATIPPSAYPFVERVVELMLQVPQMSLAVEGHTDASGSASYNLQLSRQRAAAVAAYILSHGIEPSRLKIIGKGQTDPLTENPYDPRNRRVQFVRTG